MHGILCATGLILLCAGCAAPHLEAGARYGRLSLDGDVGIHTSGVDARNSVEDLGLDDPEGVPGARVDFKWSSPHLSVSYDHASYSGTGTAEAELSQGGVTIPAGADVETDLDLDVAAAVLTFDLLPTDAFELGIGFGVSGLGFDGSIREIGGGLGEVEGKQFAPVPVVAVRGGASFGRWSASLLLAGMQVQYGGDEFGYFDFDLQGRVELFSLAHLMVGWRELRAEAEFEDDGADVDLDLELSGPYLGLAVGF